MFQHQLRFIVRSLFKHKSFTLINLAGLSIGLAAVVIIFLVLKYEKSFDHFHTNTGKIFRIVTKADQAEKSVFQAASPYPTARFLRNEYAGLTATQISFSDDVNIRIGQQDAFEEKNVVYADSQFFNVLDYAGIPNFWRAGNPVAVLSAPRQAILTESTAKRYFGTENPIGKIFRINNKADIVVAGLVKDIPANTHLPVNMIISLSTLTTDFLGGLDPDNWDFTSNGFTYVRLHNVSDKERVEKALATVIQKHKNEDSDSKKQMTLQSLHQIHFDPLYEDGNPTYTISDQYLSMLLLLGVFILLIACINYINLSTSVAVTKSKEVGIRKTIGASRKHLFMQYMLETMLVTLIAATIAVFLTWLALPSVNQITGKSLNLTSLMEASFIGAVLIVLFVISFVSGFYPALIVSGYNPIQSLKNAVVVPGKTSTGLRKGLVVFQFTTCIALIFCTIVIARQMQLFQQKEMGFNKETVVEVGLPQNDSTKIEKFRSLLFQQKGIQQVSFCLGAPISNNGLSVGMKAPQLPSNTEYITKVIICDKDYQQTYGLKLAAGRWFLPSEEKNIGSAIVVNQTLMRTLGYTTPEAAIGQSFQLGLNDIRPVIVGVTEDFHTTSLHQEIVPVAMTPFPYFYYAAAIRIQPNAMQETLANVEKAWKTVYPESVYELKFIDQTLASLYEQESKNYQLFKVFSFVSIFISCIGLWGLIAFVVVRKTKEIGIRKVLGASVESILFLLSKDFLKLIGLALLVASPIAWYFMDRWLQDFAYRINISWWMFLLAGLLALVVAAISISFQAIKAALANPVKNLRID